MSEDLNRVATLLGETNGKLDSLITQVRDYIEAHDERHTKIDDKIEKHSAEINQAKGAKGAILAMAAGISAAGGLLGAKFLKLFS